MDLSVGKSVADNGFYACPKHVLRPYAMLPAAQQFRVFMEVKVANFPFPMQPEATALLEAERCLKALEALDGSHSSYPMSPCRSRTLLTVIQIMKAVNNYAWLEGSKPNGEELEKSEESAALSRGYRMNNREKLRKKELKEAIRVSCGKFLNPCGDAISIAYALRCFESSRSEVAFYDENSLHLKTMEEMPEMRKELLQLVIAQSIGFDPRYSWTHGTLDNVEHVWWVPSNKHSLQLNEEEVLRQAICAGWADRVAERITMTFSLCKVAHKTLQRCLFFD